MWSLLQSSNSFKAGKSDLILATTEDNSVVFANLKIIAKDQNTLIERSIHSVPLQKIKTP